MRVANFPDSTNVAALAYDDETLELWAAFLGDTLYHYDDVPAEAWEAITTAKRVGIAFAAHVKGPKYPYTKLQGEDAEEMLSWFRNAAAAIDPALLPELWKSGRGADARSDRVRGVSGGPASAAAGADDSGRSGAQGSPAADLGPTAPPAASASPLLACSNCGAQ
jgi:hypothetical protein